MTSIEASASQRETKLRCGRKTCVGEQNPVCRTLVPSRVPYSMQCRITTLTCGVLTVALLAFKVLLIWRTNINWDEFYYLSKIHLAVQDDRLPSFQTIYTHLFKWLVALGGGEIGQIRAGRLIMTVLLSVTALLLYIFASRWVSTSSAWVAPLTYLSFEHVQVHGGSFRADSLLAPILVAALMSSSVSRRRVGMSALAGVIFGFALLVSVKAILALPMLLWLLLDIPSSGRSTAHSLLSFGTATVAIFSTGLTIHLVTIQSTSFPEFFELANAAARKVLTSPPPEPRYKYFINSLQSDAFAWSLCLFGLTCSIRSGKLGVAALSLSVAPIIFYRNSFPYYYVVMLAPVSVLASYGVATLTQWLRQFRSQIANWLPLTVAALLIVNSSLRIDQLAENRQKAQIDVIDAVHRIFPTPVPYIDHSGMIASFPKTNFFMSTWGLDINQAKTSAFMPDALEQRAIMLLANRSILMPGTVAFDNNLSPADKHLIRRYYIQYWGPIFVAGREIEFETSAPKLVDLPFAGRYRNLSAGSIYVADELVRSGETFEAIDDWVKISPAMDGDLPERVRIVRSEARLPPEEAPPTSARIYDRFNLH